MTGTEKIAIFGSAVALALAVGFGGVGVSFPGNSQAATTQSAPSVVSAPANAPSGVHYAKLTSCVSGLDC